MASDHTKKVCLIASVWTLLASAEAGPTAAVDAVLATAALDIASPATRGIGG